MSEFYDAEQPIIDRLKAEVVIAGTTIHYASSAVLGGSINITPLLPIIFVEPGDAKPNLAEDQSDDGALPELQIWTVVLCVKALPDLQNLNSTHEKLGGALMKLIKNALIGWSPFNDGATLVYTGRAKPLQPFDGVMEFSIDFALPVLVQSTT